MRPGGTGPKRRKASREAAKTMKEETQMERITRTITLLQIEAPSGEQCYLAPSDIEMAEGCKVLGRKKVVAEMPLSVFIENAYIKEVK